MSENYYTYIDGLLIYVRVTFMCHRCAFAAAVDYSWLLRAGSVQLITTSVSDHRRPLRFWIPRGVYATSQINFEGS